MLVRESLFADIKNDSIAMAGEFVGTILFLVTSLGVGLGFSFPITWLSAVAAAAAAADAFGRQLRVFRLSAAISAAILGPHQRQAIVW